MEAWMLIYILNSHITVADKFKTESECIDRLVVMAKAFKQSKSKITPFCYYGVDIFPKSLYNTGSKLIVQKETL
jgi:hypothetical protein